MLNLLPLMAEDDGTNVGGTQPTAESHETKGADEPKTGKEDIKSEAQILADGMFAKRMKGISKEDVEAYKTHKAEFAEYLEAKKTEAERVAEMTATAEKLTKEAKAKEAKAEAMMLAMKSGIKPEHIDDAVILAMARVNDDTSLEDAINKIAETNTAWKVGANLGDKGGNPPAKDESDSEIKTFF